jgi:catechol 2,3-dioxygenase-like lactoylglutathione lyase family enzyme
VLTRIDHVMICVPDLTAAITTYTRLGFHVYPGGRHTGRATHNAIAFHDEDYLELLSLRAEAREALAPGSADAQVAEFLARGGGFRFVVVQSDDLPADVAAMRRRGVEVSEPLEGGRLAPDGQALRWRAASLGPSHPLPLLFLQHLTPLPQRRATAARLGPHPNGVTRVERAYVAVRDVTAEAETYACVLGVPVPKIQRGSVIKADMAVFDLGPTGFTLAQPAEPGPAAEAMARRGPGPFQVLYRTRSLDAAARWLADTEVPTIRGTRNTGEQAMLVPPEHACGVYIGFVGPA